MLVNNPFNPGLVVTLAGDKIVEIEGKEISFNLEFNEDFMFDPVTYVPGHAESNAGHSDCEQGVIVGVTSEGVRVLYCKSRTVQLTNPGDLVWG